MAEKPSKWRVFTTGILRENPVLRLVLGCCSALAVTTTDELTEVENLTTANVSGAVKTAAGDVAVKAAATGYSGKDVTVYVAFDADGAISGISIDASTQTTGIGSKVGEERFASGFMGWNGGKVSAGSPVDSVSGATYSTNAVYNAVNAAIDCYNNEIKGGM